MTAAYEWLAHNADWLSATFGLLSAAIFAWPGLRELAGRRHMDGLGKLARDNPTGRRSALSDDRQEIEQNLASLRDQRLGGYLEARTPILIASGLLLMSFAFDLLYAVTKATF